MIENIVHTALLFSLLLIIPSMLKNVDVPFFVKAIIMVVGIFGIILSFFGSIALIWLN